MEEEARLNVLQARREQIRGTLRAAESTRNFRLENGLVPELDEDGKPIKSDSKAALTFSAFVIAAGAIALRVGGRAALVSAMGLDFANENPQLKDNLDSVLSYAGSLDPLVEGALFLAAWTAVKLLCFDAGGVVLALASGILFGGVFQGAVLSALCATIGSSIAFGLAKLETPVRQKALEIVDEYPSLRGIEKVVARDGFKAILTLRLAPVLPIPLGMYNYVYGVTAVPFLDFFAGIFIGSLKPYLLDSYLGYFGKTIVDGSAASDPTNIQDIILLVVLGVSVLIGVFASQLAGETWDTVLEEVEEEKKAKADKEGEPSNDGIIREFLGFKLPQWVVGFQISMAMADDRVHQFIYEEFDAKVWNYTKSDGGPPADLDPAKRPDSPETVGINKGFDFVASLCDGLVLSPALFSSYLRYADPLFDEEKDKEMRSKPRDFLESSGAAAATLAPVSAEPTEEVLLAKLDELRSITKERLERLEALLTAEVDKEKEELWSRTKERLNNLDALLPPEKPNKNRL
jgi:uncharacterized membrane protein YdjX (TVP38/TMEM64 family)